jgi:hypothetical protein
MKTFTLATALALVAGAGFAEDLSGHYRVKGTNFDGSIYEGEATITATSEFTCEIMWNTGDTTSSGICMRNGNAFTAAYEMGGEIGLVIYLIQDNGTLEGTWTAAGVNAIGTETMTPD